MKIIFCDTNNKKSIVVSKYNTGVNLREGLSEFVSIMISKMAKGNTDQFFVVSAPLVNSETRLNKLKAITKMIEWLEFGFESVCIAFVEGNITPKIKTNQFF